MVSACFERAGFSLYGRDWIGCVPGGTLLFQRGTESMHRNPVWMRKKSAYSVSVALRASMALGSQPGASSVPEAKETVRINSRADIKVRGGFVRGIERSAGVINNSVMGVTPSWASCGVRVSKGTRVSDDDAVPEISSGSRSLYPFREVVYQPKKTKQLEGFGPS